jgi:membrane protein
MAALTFFRLFKAALERWWAENPFRLGASLAYYTVISLAPVVLIAVSIAGLVVQKQAARDQLLSEIRQTMGNRIAQAVETTLQYGQDTGSSVLATVVGLVVLLFGASSVFVELQDDLNMIWGVRPKEGVPWWKLVTDRFWSFTAVLGVGFLLLVSLIFSAVLSYLGGLLSPATLPGLDLWHALHWVVSFAVITLLFALIYKLLPDVELAWGDVWVGAALTAFLFSVGKYLIGIYLGQSSWVSAYGAAGSLVLLLLWVYYSSQIFLFGAEFTYGYAQYTGKPLVPQEHAEPTTEEARHRAEEPAALAAGNRVPAESAQPRYGLVTTVLSALAILLVSGTIKAVDEAANKKLSNPDNKGGGREPWSESVLHRRGFRP